MKTTVTLQPETAAAIEAVPSNFISGQAARRGVAAGEPLIVIMDGLLRYAKAHKARFGDPLAADYVLGPAWIKALCGARELLDGDGAAAHEQGVSTDSKDNGSLESVFWAAMQAAGFEESDIV